MEPQCPELLVKRGGNELKYICKVADKRCPKEHGYECEDYVKWLEAENKGVSNE